MKKVVVASFLCLSSAISPAPAHAHSLDPLRDYRYCGPPDRTASGNIKRDTSVLSSFKKLYPCPANLKSTGSCPGWAIDHVVPLACGGCDSVSNLQWLPVTLKKTGPDAKDTWERKVYENSSVYRTVWCKQKQVVFDK